MGITLLTSRGGGAIDPDWRHQIVGRYGFNCFRRANSKSKRCTNRQADIPSGPLAPPKIPTRLRYVQYVDRLLPCPFFQVYSTDPVLCECSVHRLPGEPPGS